MNNKERIENFMKEYEELCVRHGLSLGHEDYEGGFIIDEYDADNIEWGKSAMNGFELREKRQKEIEEIHKKDNSVTDKVFKADWPNKNALVSTNVVVIQLYPKKEG